jgi:hypothetical protein
MQKFFQVLTFLTFIITISLAVGVERQHVPATIVVGAILFLIFLHFSIENQPPTKVCGETRT